MDQQNKLKKSKKFFALRMMDNPKIVYLVEEIGENETILVGEDDLNPMLLSTKREQDNMKLFVPVNSES